MSVHPDIERVALLGWRLAPCTRTKKGMFRGYREAATHDLNTLERWERSYPRANWCLATGPASGVWCLDVDRPGADHAADGRPWLRALVERFGPLPEAPWQRTGGGGSALYFRCNGPATALRSRTAWPVPGLDIRAARVVTTVPPSRHRSGGAYRWRVAPWELNPPEAPSWLLDACLPPPEPPRPARPVVVSSDSARRRLFRAVDTLCRTGTGGRNATLNREGFAVARWVGAGMLGEREATDALEAAALSIGLDAAEVRDTLASAFRAGTARPVEARA